MKTIIGWWFAPKSKKLTNGDNRKITIGCTHKVTGRITPCSNGLHLSKRSIDALAFAPGPVVYKVKGSGTIVPHNNPVANKYACSERTYISGGIDCTDVLKSFAKRCALDVIHLWKAPDIVMEYLKTGKEESRAASRLIAWDATNSIEGSAAWNAAWDATNNIMKIVTWSTMQTVWSAAKATAWNAVKDMSKEEVAWSAAWHTACIAYTNKANRRLNAMLTKCIIP